MELYPYQKEAVRAVFDFYRTKPTQRPLLIAPTGSGKSHIIAAIIQRIIEKKPAYRIVVVSHRKEIIDQNVRKLAKVCQIPIGVYSAGLKSKTIRGVTFANIQSIYKKKLEAQLIIVDECHLIPGRSDSMYQKFLDGCREINPAVKILGLTATPYRLDQGSLLGGFFDDVCFEIDLRSLIVDGYLAPLVSKVAKEKVSLDGVRKSGYDYNLSELAERFSPHTLNHCAEIIKRAEDRKHWLIFCTSIEHARKTSHALRELGISSEYVSSEMLDMERDQVLNRFSAGEFRALCNCEIATTGYDFPGIDLIVLLRATQSTGLFVQMCGRGMRKAAGKKDCLVLDFGSNILRHGPIDCIVVKRKKGEKKALIFKEPTKECLACGAVVNIKHTSCPSCDAPFPPREEKTEPVPEESAPIISKAETFQVRSMEFCIHYKKDKPPSFRIDYLCSAFYISEYLCFEHFGYAAVKAGSLWLARGGRRPAPRTSQEALDRSGELLRAGAIEVVKDGKWNRVTKIFPVPAENSVTI